MISFAAAAADRMIIGENGMSGSYRFVVAGRVQGVGFRQAVMGKALVLGLCGWVRNRDDGRVEGCVGSEDGAAMDEFRHFVGHGTGAARVETLSWKPCEAVDEAGFRVLR